MHHRLVAMMLAVLALVLYGLWAPGLPLVSSRLLRAISVYYLLGYVGRGLYLVLVDPIPRFGTFIADDLLRRPTYFDGLRGIAPIAIIGLSAVFVGYVAVSKRLPALPASTSFIGWRQATLVLAMLGWAARLAAAGSGSLRPEGLMGRVAVAPTMAVGLLIFVAQWRRRRALAFVLVTLVAGEVLWSIVSATKTPLMATAAFVYLDPTRRRVSWRVVAAGSCALLLGFGLIQPSKTELASADYGGHPALVPVGRVLARFDLLRSLTVAADGGPGSYMAGGEFAQRLASATIPDAIMGRGGTPSGVLWGQRMNGSTSGVSLADGPTAEGYAVAGPTGAIAFGLVIGAVAAWVARVLVVRRSIVLTSIAAYLIGSNAMLERGLLGIVEAAASGVQLALVAALALVIVRRALRTKRSPAEPRFVRSDSVVPRPVA